MQRWLAIPRDLSLQLLSLYLLLIIPFLVTLLIFDRLIGERIREDVQASDLSLAQSISQEVDLEINKSLNVVDGLAKYPSVIQVDQNAMRDIFSVIVNTSPDINLVYRLDSKGIMLYHYPEGPGSTVGNDFSFREYYQRAMLAHAPLVSKGRISPTTNQAVATAVMPIWSKDGIFLGLVGANIRLESLSQTLTNVISEHQSDEGLQVVILDSADQIIAYPDAQFLLHPAGDVIPNDYLASLGGNDLAQVLASPSGEDRLFTHTLVPAINWDVVVSRPTSAAFATQINLRRIVTIAATAFILIGLFFWVALTFRVIRPVERLAPISEAIGMNQPISEQDQKLLYSEANRNDQIGHLMRSILRMREYIAERMQEQATLLDTSTAVVSTLDTETVLNRILEQMGRLLQIKMYAVIALDQENETFRIRASRGLSKQFTEQLSIQPTEPDSVTMRALHSREPIQVSDTETDPSYTARRVRARTEGYRAILAVPLNTNHAPPTALLVFHPTPHVFTHNELQLLTSFANHAAMAIENAVLYERSDMRLRDQTHRLEALVQSLHDGLILSDLEDKVIYVNKSVSELAGIPAKKLMSLHTNEILARIIDQSAKKPGRKSSIRNLLNKRGELNVELSLNHGEKLIHLRLALFNVNDEDGMPIGRGIFFQDVTADRELDRMKSSLISTVSHELRTPLAAIKGYVSTMLAEDVEWDHASQHEFLTIISNESDRLTNLVNNLLDLSRLEAGFLKLVREKCNLRSIINHAAEQAHLTFTNELRIKIQSQLPDLYADQLRLESIIRNLIENAIKYGGEKATIKVEVCLQGREFLFRVNDNGPGISPIERQRVFESFYRVDKSLARLAGGAGLGLAICQGLVRAHGGKIWAEDVATGASIAFTIPVQLPPSRKKSSKRNGN